jgi:hypothetical protein
MQIVGTLLAVCSVGAAFWWRERRGVLAAAILGVVAGLALTIQDRITELPLPGFGTIKAAAEQATIDAATISILKERVENQSATVDAVAAQASGAKVLAQQAEEQTKQAAQRLEDLDKAIAEATARANEAELKLQRFRAPRTLSPEQQARIVALLKPFAGQEYTLSVSSGSEPGNLLCAIDGMLAAAEWKNMRHSGESLKRQTAERLM